MAGIVRNTLVNLTAHGVNAAVALLLAPVLVLAYGIDKYGLIVLARNLLPGGFVSLFDFGLPEAITRYTASTMASAQRDKAQNLVVSAMLIAAGIGVLVAAALAGFGHLLIAYVFRVPNEFGDSFAIALWASAAVLTVQFPGFILKAALEGLERFDVVRTGEIASTLAYAGGAAAMAIYGAAYHWVILMFVATSTARFLYFGLYLQWRKPAGMHLSRGRWSRSDVGPALSHAGAFFQAKTLSVAFNFAPSMVISSFAGPAATGVYDLVMRIPRMVKVLSGMLGSALLPFASKAEATPQFGHVERVIYSGTMLAVVLVAPLATAIAVLSQDVLVAWLGAQFTDLAPWLALAMSWPLLIGWTGIGNSMVIANPGAVRRLNRVSLLQVAIFYAVSFLAGTGNLAFGFVIGTVASVLIASPLQVLLLVRYYRLDLVRYLAPVGKVIITGIGLFLLVHALHLDAPRAGIPLLAARLALWCVAYWAILYFWVLAAGERREIDHVARRLAVVLGVRRTADR